MGRNGNLLDASSLEIARHILQRDCNHLTVWPRWRTALFLLSVVGLVLFAMPFRLSTSVAATVVAQDKPLKAGANTLFERVIAMEPAAASEGAVPLAIHGVVRKPDFTPARAVVFCLSTKNAKTQLIGRTTTDASGRYSFNLAPSESQREGLSLYAVDSLNQLAWNSSLQFTTEMDSHNISFVLT